MCECNLGWTGPNCLAQAGFDPIHYDVPDKITDLGFIPPKVAPRGLFAGFVVLAVTLIAIMRLRHRLQGWTPIPEIDYSSDKPSHIVEDYSNRRVYRPGGF